MVKHGFHSVDEAAAMILAGRVLLLAGDETLLDRLPDGAWIGGTAAQFMGPEGGVTERDRVFVSDLSAIAAGAGVRVYGIDELDALAQGHPDHGFSVVVVPGFSGMHAVFARELPSHPEALSAPLLGWVSGVPVDEIGFRAPKVFAGSGRARSQEAAVLRVGLPAELEARLDIVNLFEPGDGPAIEFDQEGFHSDRDCRIDGRPARLADYLAARHVDLRLPLVADYCGAMVNVSIRSLDTVGRAVQFYAPVFRGTRYRFARPVPDYPARFGRAVDGLDAGASAFSCNCVLNYVHGGVEGRRTGPLQGPITFGEIAYLLLNQTLVCLSVGKAA